MIGRNKETDCGEERYSAVADYAIIKFALCLSIKHGSKIGKTDLEIPMLTGRLKRAVYAELSKQVLLEASHQGKVMKLKKALLAERQCQSAEQITLQKDNGTPFGRVKTTTSIFSN